MNCHKIDFFHPKCSHNHRKAVRRKLVLNKILNYYLNNSPLFNSDTIPGTRNVIPTVRARGKNLPTPSFIGFPLMMAKYGFANHAEIIFRSLISSEISLCIILLSMIDSIFLIVQET